MTILSRNHDGYITKHEMLETIKKLTEKQVHQKIKERTKDIKVTLKKVSYEGVERRYNVLLIFGSFIELLTSLSPPFTSESV